MGAILLDLNTGDPYLDEKCNTVEVDDDRAFEQIIDGLFHCDPGSEIMNPYYGFDLQAALRNSQGPAGLMYVESLVTEALSSENERLIYSVDYLEATRDEDNPKTIKVVLSVTSVLQNNISITQEIGD